MAEKIDLFGFIKLCDDALGIKPAWDEYEDFMRSLTKF